LDATRWERRGPILLKCDELEKTTVSMSALPPPDTPHSRPRWLVPAAIAVLVALVAGGIWYYRSRGEPAPAGSPATASTDGKGAKSGKAGKAGRFAGTGGPQPVAAAPARRGDINIVQTALGTATALRTVTVKPRVDGQLQAVLFAEGQLVKQGEVIAQIDPVPLQVALAQAEGTLARDAAQLNNARLDLDRYKKLLEQDSIAQQQVDQQAALVRQLEGTIKVSQAQVDNAKLQLSYARITAPIGGRLGLRVVDPGNMVRGSDAAGVAVITQVDPISVVFTIPQDTLPRVLARLNAGDKPPVEAWDREQKELLARGTLVTTDNQIDVTTGTIKLKAQFPNKESRLFPNQFVNVRMVVDVRRDAVLVPSAAIQRGTQGNLVYVVRDDSTVALRPVTVGPTEGQLTAVESGLQAGERVITDGVDRIREGVKVEVTEPGAGARGGGTGRGQGTDPAKREELRKKLEAMTPEQREESRKRREAAGKGAEAPAKAPEPAKLEPAPETDGRAEPAQRSPQPSGSTREATRDDFRKRLEGMTPEQRREATKQRLDSMTPEQREAWKKRREAEGKATQ
jgi:multidrug efflux system membrane fusion protein